MPSLKTFSIEFDRSSATYATGEVVTGSVIVDLSKEKKFRALKLLIRGEAAVYWATNESPNKRTTKLPDLTHGEYRNNELYFHKSAYLLGGPTDSEVLLPGGFHTYSFQFTLPHNIPCSFEHPFGYIRYTAKAIIDRPWRFDHECKTAFTVVTPYDLNLYKDQCPGVDDEITGNFCCFCFFNMGSIRANIVIPPTGFVPGQTINTKVYINNNSSIQVTEVSVKLERFLKFYARAPLDVNQIDISIVKSDHQIAEHTEVVSHLLVPPIPPSQLMYCTIIDLKYQLSVEIHVSGMHCNIGKTYPVVIGTIPLHSTLPSAPYYSQSPSQPTAPLIDYDLPPPMQMPMPMPMSTNELPYPGPSQLIGFASTQSDTSSTSQWNLPPPSYEKYMQTAQNIKDRDESSYVYGADKSFAPRYPLFNFSALGITMRNCLLNTYLIV